MSVPGLFLVVALFFPSISSVNSANSCSDTSIASSGLTSCFNALIKEVAELHMPFIPSNLNGTITAFINASWTYPSLNYSLCNCTLQLPAINFHAMPVPLQPYVQATASSMRHIPSLQFSYKETPKPNQLYTFMMMDPYVGPPDKPLNHWTVINFDGNNVSTGKVLMPYIGPHPRPTSCISPKFYFFLLFTQQGFVNLTDLSNYPPPNPSCPRCSFPLLKYITDQNLTLIGLTWQSIGYDPWVAFDYISLGRPLESTGFSCSMLSNCQYSRPSSPCPLPTVLSPTVLSPTVLTKGPTILSPTSGEKERRMLLVYLLFPLLAFVSYF